MRASFMHSNFEALSALGAGAAARVRARLPVATVREIEEASRLAWLPVELDIAITDAIDTELGREAMRRWAREGLLRSTEGPLLSPIIRSARTIFGITPHSFFRRASNMWAMIYRGCGELRLLDESEGRVVLELRGAPQVFRRSPAYLEGIAATFEAATVLAGEPDRIRVTIDARGEPIVFTGCW